MFFFYDPLDLFSAMKMALSPLTLDKKYRQIAQVPPAIQKIIVICPLFRDK